MSHGGEVVAAGEESIGEGGGVKRRRGGRVREVGVRHGFAAGERQERRSRSNLASDFARTNPPYSREKNKG